MVKSHAESTKYLRFLCRFTSWSCGCIEKQIQCWKNCWYSYNIDKCNKILCLSSRNMIDKTMCEVLWRNISQPQLQLVNLHRNRRYFVIKLHTWFCLSYFLKTNIKVCCIYQYCMSINSFFNTVSAARNSY
jgi:hypothetical protein